MLTERRNQQLKMHVTTLEELVPQEHFLRKVESMVDFGFVYDEVRPYYCANNGRNSVDPVIIVKSLLIGFLYGINSERRLMQEISVNLAYRWFLGIDLDEKVPDHSTISQLRRRKFNQTDLFRKLFERILRQCIERGLVTGELLLTDSTHVKANAANTSGVTVEVEKEASAYIARLDAYEEAERKSLEESGRIKPKRKKSAIDEPQMTERKVSETDPDAGWLARPGKPSGFHYLSHQTIDAANGIITDVAVTPGNENDAVPYIGRIEFLAESLGLKINAVAADGSYDVGLIHQTLEEAGIMPYMAKKKHQDNASVELKREDFTYDKERDEFTCPNGKTLATHTLTRNVGGIFKLYKSRKSDCEKCQFREKCLSATATERKLLVSIFQPIIDAHHEKDSTEAYRYAMRKRQVWCEGTFAAQKARHNLAAIFRRGLRAATDHCLLSACAVNLKRLVKRCGKSLHERLLSLFFRFCAIFVFPRLPLA